MIIKKPFASLFVCLAVALLAVACAPNFELGSVDAQEPRLDAERWISRDGANHRLRSWLPEQAPKMVLIAAHGFNDHADFIAEAADDWAGQGVAVFSYDQRGFGDSAWRGLWPGRQLLASDLRSFIALLSARYPGVPLYVLGESMGGAVAVLALADWQQTGVQGLILSAPAVWSRSMMPWWQRSGLWISARLAPAWKVTGEGLDVQASDNRAMLIALGRDPRVIRETRIDALYGVVNLMDEASRSAAMLSLPVLVLYGDRDEVIPEQPVVSFVAGLPEQYRRFARYERGYHMLLRDLQAPRVWEDVLAWMRRPGSPLPSGAERPIE